MLAGAALARAVLAWANQSVAARAAAGAKEELRAALLDAALRLGPEWLAEYGPAELTALATKGLDALDDYFTRYLPALITAALAPPLVGAWILVQDWRSAILIVITVPLIPVFAILIGRFTESRARGRRGCDRAAGRAPAGADQGVAGADRVRTGRARRPRRCGGFRGNTAARRWPRCASRFCPRWRWRP